MTEAVALSLPVPPSEACRAIRGAAEAWGANLEGSDPRWTLQLPVVAGLRRGLVSGRLEVGLEGGGSRISFVPEESEYSLHASSVVVLFFSACGAVLAVLWPFWPALITVAPFGIVLALGGWFLVLNRLRNAGPEEFLKAVELEAASRPE